MNGTANNNMRSIIGAWESAFINKPHENQAKFRLENTTVYAITTFEEVTFVYDDVMITCNSDSLESILKMLWRELYLLKRLTGC